MELKVVLFEYNICYLYISAFCAKILVPKMRLRVTPNSQMLSLPLGCEPSTEGTLFAKSHSKTT